MRGAIAFDFNKKELKTFEATCEVAIRNVFRGTKKATIAACEEILANSKAQVPKQTLTLYSSGYYEVRRRGDTAKTYHAYEGTIGYGGNGDPINPLTGEPASRYMVKVHEDLNTFHPTGKAKFLEDPAREYARSKFERTVFVNAQESLAALSK